MSKRDPATKEAATPSVWAPLADRTYRILWIALLGSNIGTWMQTVGAQWFLVDRHSAASLVSLVQTASLLPVFFISLPAGVLADTFDRRRLLYLTSLAMAACGLLLTILTGAGLLNTSALLAFTFILGSGAALTAPAWQAIQPDLVPREQLPSAAALGSVTINGARAVGPALAGFVVAWAGVTPVFAINAASFLGMVIAVFVWHEPKRERRDRERFGEALSAGLRYLRSAPGVDRIILRSVLFAFPASALWALLPIAASSRFHMGATGYGLLLGALGVGAIAGVAALPRLRRSVSANALLAASAVVFGAATAVVALAPVWLTALLLVAAGFAWIGTLTSLNAGMQISLPGWTRARGMAAYVLAFMGAQAIGAVVWGLLATHAGLTASLLASAVVLGLVAASVPILPLHDRTAHLDRTIGATWPAPTLAFDPIPSDGPVLVTVTYTVDPHRVSEFLDSMKDLERSRRRTGAQTWRLYRDGALPTAFVETFTVRSWAEHLRQHEERWTGSDREVQERVLAAVRGEPRVDHLLPPSTAPTVTLTSET